MLKTRIFTALCLLGLFLPALFLLPLLAWAALTLVVTLFCLKEWAGFLPLSALQCQWFLLTNIAFGLLVLFLLAQFGFHWFFSYAIWVCAIASVFWCAVVPVIVYRNQFTRCTLTNLSVGAGLLFALWSALIIAKQISPWCLLVLMSSIWLADSAAYFAGKQFGRHKLAPAISPGKTWEGVWGALLVVGVYAFLLWGTGLVASLWIVPGLCVVAIAGVYGDLFESFYKRRANLKDSGQLLPGHGGLLDRLDGVMPAIPVGLSLLFFYHAFTQAQGF